MMSLTDDFKNALASWASGVSVVTVNEEGQLYGLTVSSFSSVSLDPPLILVCLANSNRMPSMVDRTGSFAVSILERGQEAASNYFASRGREPGPDFGEIDIDWTESGQPAITGASAWVSCKVHSTIIQGDHTICVGEVVEAKTADAADPLLYFRRAYRGVDGL